MTREEQIEEAANKLYPTLHPSWPGNENIAFQSGAEWADANPYLAVVDQGALETIQDLEAKLDIAVEALKEISKEKDCIESISTGMKQYFVTHSANLAKEVLSKLES